MAARKPRTTRRAAPAAAAPVGEDLGQLRREIEKADRDRQDQRYVLRLYVTGTTPTSAHAIQQVRAICEEHLEGRYELDVIDIYQLPALAKDHQILATPTLIKVLPTPLRRFIGDLSRAEKILFGLDLREKR